MSRLRLATHPCSNLLFKACWSGSQHVLPSRERDLTGKGGKTFTPAKSTVWLPAVDYEGKTHQEYSEREKKKLSEKYSCILSANSSVGFAAVSCFGISLSPITTKSGPGVPLWNIFFTSPECWNLENYLNVMLPAPIKQLCFIGKEILIPQV